MKVKKWRGVLQLAGFSALLWLFFGVLSPRLIAALPTLQHYGAVQEAHGVHSGLMYYTDLDTWQDTQGEISYFIRNNVIPALY